MTVRSIGTVTSVAEDLIVFAPPTYISKIFEPDSTIYVSPPSSKYVLPVAGRTIAALTVPSVGIPAICRAVATAIVPPLVRLSVIIGSSIRT